jgi:hypothetical protein
MAVLYSLDECDEIENDVRCAKPATTQSGVSIVNHSIPRAAFSEIKYTYHKESRSILCYTRVASCSRRCWNEAVHFLLTDRQPRLKFSHPHRHFRPFRGFDAAMPRDLEPSLNTKNFTLTALQNNLRLDSRSLTQPRPLKLTFGTTLGCAYVELGKTKSPSPSLPPGAKADIEGDGTSIRIGRQTLRRLALRGNLYYIHRILSHGSSVI